jgi:antitoxin component of RelBE/YafQ-DinJ toxin-antitoxin module
MSPKRGLPLGKQSPFYLLTKEDSDRIERMLSLVHLFVTELIDYRKLPFETTDLTAFDEFEAYIERIYADGRTARSLEREEDGPFPDF